MNILSFMLASLAAVNFFQNFPQTLTCPDNLTIELPTGECEVSLDYSTLVWSSTTPVADTIFSPAPGFAFSSGETVVTLIAVDTAGNMEICSFEINVQDVEAPVAKCKSPVILDIYVGPPFGKVFAADLDDASTDNCQGAFSFSFSADPANDSLFFDCPDVEAGLQEVQLWVTDAQGNQSTCYSILLFAPGTAIHCGDPLLAGVISTWASQKIKDVQVNITGSNGFSDSLVTDLNGAYTFLPPSGSYVITSEKNTAPLNGVSTFDLVLITKHILGTQTFDSPYKLIAADANKSGAVTTADLVWLRKMILFVEAGFPNGNKSWRFIPKSYVFPNLANPFEEQFPEVLQVGSLWDGLSRDFIGVKVGDVNGSAATN